MACKVLKFSDFAWKLIYYVFIYWSWTIAIRTQLPACTQFLLYCIPLVSQAELGLVRTTVLAIPPGCLSVCATYMLVRRLHAEQQRGGRHWGMRCVPPRAATHDGGTQTAKWNPTSPTEIHGSRIACHNHLTKRASLIPILTRTSLYE